MGDTVEELYAVALSSALYTPDLVNNSVCGIGNRQRLLDSKAYRQEKSWVTVSLRSESAKRFNKSSIKVQYEEFEGQNHSSTLAITSCVRSQHFILHMSEQRLLLTPLDNEDYSLN